MLSKILNIGRPGDISIELLQGLDVKVDEQIKINAAVRNPLNYGMNPYKTKNYRFR